MAVNQDKFEVAFNKRMAEANYSAPIGSNRVQGGTTVE